MGWFSELRYREMITGAAIHDLHAPARWRKAADPDKIRAEYGKDGVFICYDYLTKRGLASITSPLLEYGQKSRPAY